MGQHSKIDPRKIEFYNDGAKDADAFASTNTDSSWKKDQQPKREATIASIISDHWLTRRARRELGNILSILRRAKRLLSFVQEATS